MLDDPLRRMILEDVFDEIFWLLTPAERQVAALRAEGLLDRQIAEMLGIRRSAVAMRMVRARRRVALQAPHLAPYLSGHRLWPG
jgi:FixJ family two-component response regulator